MREYKRVGPQTRNVVYNKILEMNREYQLINPGDHIVCAVSGGADSMALLCALWNLQNKLQITVSAAHFNHNLRGDESMRDENFVKTFCMEHGIPVEIASGNICIGKKGVEDAAREARYAFLKTLPGKIATAHTADDNAETVLMHLIRGTGLRGLGGIAPLNENVIRPLLMVTRTEIEDFLNVHEVRHIEDSSNATDDYFRNRIRHHVMPLLKEENARLSEQVSTMAMELRDDEKELDFLTPKTNDISKLRKMNKAMRRRALKKLLYDEKVKDVSRRHIALAEKVVMSQNPNAEAKLPGNIRIVKKCGTLQKKIDRGDMLWHEK